MMASRRIYQNFSLLMQRTLAVFAFTIVILTVFVTDNSLYQGVISAKYFWFAVVICIISFLIPFCIFKKIDIYIIDVLSFAFIAYICINWFFLNNRTNMHWYLTLMMIPLYIAVRIVAENEKITIPVDTVIKNRFYRFIKDEGTIDLAEIHFYDTNSREIKGKWIEGHRTITNHDLPKINDDNRLTFSEIQSWIGVDFGKEVALSKI